MVLRHAKKGKMLVRNSGVAQSSHNAGVLLYLIRMSGEAFIGPMHVEMSISLPLQNELLKNPKALTAAQATDLLDLVNTKADLQALIDNLDTSTHGNTTVLYSGAVGNSVWSTDVINDLKTKDSLRILDNTEAFKF